MGAQVLHLFIGTSFDRFVLYMENFGTANVICVSCVIRDISLNFFVNSYEYVYNMLGHSCLLHQEHFSCKSKKL